MRFEGHVAVITGAGRGIGLATARRLASEGAAVAMLDVDSDAVERGAESLRREGCRVMGLTTDVTSEEHVIAAVEAAENQLGAPTILVNNAGIYPHIAIEDMTVQEWRRILSVNLDSMFMCSKAVLPIMKEAGYGRIVNFASAVAQTGLEKVSAYASAKAGVIGFTRVLASEAGPFGITVNAVAPGLIATEGVLSQIAEHFDDVLPIQKIKRRGTPEDISAAVAFLASPEAGFVTGEVLAVNGGLVYG